MMFAGIYYWPFKDGREIRQINTSHTLMNLQYLGHDLGSTGGSRKKKIEAAVLFCLVSAVSAWLPNRKL